MSVPIVKITTTACPSCGCAVIVGEELEISTFGATRAIRQHTNGDRWERRTFLCGLVIAWIPNFRREECVQICQQHEDIARIELKRRGLQERRRRLEEAEEKIEAEAHLIKEKITRVFRQKQ